MPTKPKLKQQAPNTLKADPTQTTTLRRAFATEFNKRFDRVKRQVLKLVVEEDAFGLTEPQLKNPLALNTRWRFHTASKQLELFAQWIKELLGQEIIGVEKDAYWNKYIMDGYAKGAGKAFDAVRQRKWGPHGGDFYQGSKMEFLRSAFARPVSVERVKVLASRVMTDLKQTNETMATQMQRVLTDGLVQGKNPREVGRELAKAVDKGKVAATRIARTETIRAHAEGQLDGLEALGIEEVGVMVEWEVTPDARLCPLCKELDGIVLKTKEAHGLLPRHPNCRCSWMPANVGESDKKQIRRKDAIRRAIIKSVAKERQKGSIQEKLKRSSWLGADRKIAKARPESILK